MNLNKRIIIAALLLPWPGVATRSLRADPAVTPAPPAFTNGTYPHMTVGVSDASGVINPSFGKVLVAAGTSITAGYGVGGPAYSWPSQIVTGGYGTAFAGMTIINSGSSGNTVAALMNTWSTVIAPHLPNVTGLPTTVHIEILANDVNQYFYPGTAAISGDLATIIGWCHASGTTNAPCRVILCTVLPRWDTRNTANMSTKIETRSMR